MKKYRRPLCKRINLEGEPILVFNSVNNKKGYDGGIGGFAKKNNQLFDDDEEEGL